MSEEIDHGAIGATIDMMKAIMDNMAFASCRGDEAMQQGFVRNALNNFIGNFYLEHCPPDRFEEAITLLLRDLNHFFEQASKVKKDVH